MPNINRNGELDREETEILEAYERGELDGAPVSNDMVLGAKETKIKGVGVKLHRLRGKNNFRKQAI